jgi:L-ribulokinase
MKISRSAQTCALGAAIFGSVVGGAHRTVKSAQRHMTGVKQTTYRPRRSAVKIYAELYQLYRSLHDTFGVTGQAMPLDGIMKELIKIRSRVRR